MNGDILTDLNYNYLFKYHKKSNHFVTIATYFKQVQIDVNNLIIWSGFIKNLRPYEL